MSDEELVAVNYSGCGYRYVAVKDGEIVAALRFESVSEECAKIAGELIDQDEYPWELILDILFADQNIKAREIAWAELKESCGCEIWMGMFSCTQLCRPRKVIFR
jgi:hypothetical protein